MSPRAVADAVMANLSSYRGVEAIPTMKTKTRIKHDPSPRLWQRHGAGERVRPRFRAAGNHVVRRATRRKMSKTMRINEEGHGNGGDVPQRLMKWDDHPQWRGQAAAKREQEQKRDQLIREQEVEEAYSLARDRSMYVPPNPEQQRVYEEQQQHYVQAVQRQLAPARPST